MQERGLDFAEADDVFSGLTVTMPDKRRDYGEARFITVGYLRGHFVVLVWAPRGSDQHVISMRYGHGKEERRWGIGLD